MRLYEITNENQPIIDLNEIKIQFDKEYNELISLINTYNKMKNNLTEKTSVLMITEIKSLLNNFEINLYKFTKSEQLDFTNDEDLQSFANLANHQLDHINKLMKSSGIN